MLMTLSPPLCLAALLGSKAKAVERLVHLSVGHKNADVYTATMRAASRARESTRPDALFKDELGTVLAGHEAINNPMGKWI